MARQHGAGKALNSLKIRAPRDFWGGLALIALAVIAFWATRDLGGMQGVAFGPGTAPRLFSGLLAVIGCVVTATGLLTDGPRSRPSRYAGRPSCSPASAPSR